MKPLDVKTLRELTGMGMIDCKNALEYAEEHLECTAIGYLKAKAFAVKTSYSFEERVISFSKVGEDLF